MDPKPIQSVEEYQAWRASHAEPTPPESAYTPPPSRAAQPRTEGKPERPHAAPPVQMRTRPTSPVSTTRMRFVVLAALLSLIGLAVPGVEGLEGIAFFIAWGLGWAGILLGGWFVQLIIALGVYN